MGHPHLLRQVEHGVDGGEAAYVGLGTGHHRPEESRLARGEVRVDCLPQLRGAETVARFDILGEPYLAPLLPEFEGLPQALEKIVREDVQASAVGQDLRAPDGDEGEAVADPGTELLLGQMPQKLALCDVADDAHVRVGGPQGAVLGQRLERPVVPGVTQDHRERVSFSACYDEHGGEFGLLDQEPLVIRAWILDLDAFVRVDDDGVADPVDQSFPAGESGYGASLVPLFVGRAHQAIYPLRSGPLASLCRFSDEHGPDLAEVLVILNYEVRAASDAVAHLREEGDEQAGWVGFRVGLDPMHHFAREPVVCLLGHDRPVLGTSFEASKLFGELAQILHCAASGEEIVHADLGAVFLVTELDDLYCRSPALEVAC